VPQSVRPVSQPHLPPLQWLSPLHVLPHAPQFESLVSSETHESPHAVSSEAHFETHFPCEQSSPEWHGCPQAPQFAASEFVSVHLPLHSVLPGAQAQFPWMHVIVAMHALPQPPQL